VADVAEFVGALSDATAGMAPVPAHDIGGVRHAKARLLGDPQERVTGMRVHQVVDCMNTVLSGAGTFVSDIGMFRHFGALFARADEPYRFLTSAGCSSFGYGLPAAMAVKLVRPSEPVLLITGDGGLHSNSGDIETAVRLGLGIVIVVVNNSRNGLIELYQGFGHQRSYPPATRFGDVDFVQLALANGAGGVKAYDRASLLAALRKGIDLQSPYLIEVPIEYDLRPDAYGAIAL
jgi:N2-(2-carboxyethyl)arginine synthase